ncbi:MAG: TonB-dependent receptor [Ignavibacteriae bacterium]|nr:TonB-dependent receptor [Ignavibacteriota bacterium]MCB9208937.1 TonB-dependent receptor [Ignavibacteriales bacterium]MCB9218142.1 TonB-dependent receptor [Ignavibacteriales bacterium]MCB9260531.1 TonB-dependent receptor [Ignavibacteriales bacterium]
MGSVVDSETGTPLPFANIIIEGTTIGAATDMNGEYFILNVTPGKYTLRAQMMGYEAQIIEGVIVSVNRTSNIDVKLRETVLEGEEVVVVANKLSIKKDQTSSVKNVSSEQIEMLPVEDLDQVIAMQAGVVDGHFRGGRLTEVSYLVDGMQVNEAFGGTDKTVSIEKEAAQDLEVITGTFNAEYGRAMSGIVNVVTKDGGNQYKASFSSHVSNFYTANSDVFIGLSNTEFARNQDYKLQLEGPVIPDLITFFTNFRYQKSLGHINGIRRFNVDDYSNATDANKFGVNTPWDFDFNGQTYYSEHTGDGEYVPINTNLDYSGMGKLTFNISTDLKASVMGTLNYSETPNSGHVYKYKPDGRATFHNDSKMGMFQLNHFLSNSAFHDLKLSYVDNHQYSWLYEDPFDPRYVHAGYGGGMGGFSTGGQDRGHSERKLIDLNAKYDLVWQVNTSHAIKTGFLYTHHTVENLPILTQNALRGTPLAQLNWYNENTGKVEFYPYQTELYPDDAIEMDRYKKQPFEFSAYIQDKMEFDEMVINLGLRYDYFNPNTTYPSQRRNPANQLLFYQLDENDNIMYDDNGNPILDSERMSSYPKAPAQFQLSPRFGLSYTLGSAAVLHFSYGHFFQMPPLYTLYSNYRNLIPTGDFQTVQGNPLIKAEKTVSYEMGIWQELLPNMGLELSVYYKDIYDLLSAVVYTTYNQIKYGLYSNKDYGNAKGFEMKFDYLMGPFSLYANYTLQYTRGNADDPTTTYSRLGQSLDPVPYLVPLNWDQRHTANISLGYNQEDFGVTLTGYLNSGRPYTFTPVSISPLAKQTLYPNNSERPTTYTIDLSGHYDFDIGDVGKLRFYLSVYNLLDRKNELSVNSTTGRAYTAIVYPVDFATFISNYNDIYDSIQNPYMYSAPREIKIGIGLVL